MHPYVKEFRKYLSDHPLRFADPDISTLLDFLWHAYTEDNPIENSSIRAQFNTLDKIFTQLSFDDTNLLFSTVCSLCLEHESAAFVEGIKLGFALKSELSDLSG